MSKWIESSALKSNPPDKEEVLVFLRYGDSLCRIDIGRAIYKYGSKKMHDWETFIDDDWYVTSAVTHWMPLPEPPKN